jgi:hypothetical protein
MVALILVLELVSIVSSVEEDEILSAPGFPELGMCWRAKIGIVELVAVVSSVEENEILSASGFSELAMRWRAEIGIEMWLGQRCW